MSTGFSTTTNIPLQGRILILVRAIWAIVFGVALVVFLFGIPLRYTQLNTDPINTQLLQYGLPGGLYAGYRLTLNVLYTLIFWFLGLLIVWRKLDDRMALFVSFFLITFGLTGTPGNSILDAYEVYRPPVLLSLSRGVAFVAWPSLYAFFYLFPTGRFVPRWTKILLLTIILFGIPWNLFPDSPFSPPKWPLAIFGPLALIFWGSMAFAQVYRYRRASSPRQRQQIKWLALGMSLSALIMLPVYLITLSSPLPASPSLGELVFHSILGPLVAFSLIFIPISIAISILHYRLWEIDFFINRSLVYGALTVLLALIFGSSLFIISQVFQTFTGGQHTVGALVVAALVFGMLFQPARTRLQRFVDRRFYNIHIDYLSDPQPPPNIPASTRQTSFGAYKNLQLIGRGGMAEVYKADHPTLNRPVAIKLLPPQLAAESNFRQRFAREAQLIANLKHPNIVQVFDFGELGETSYMVMEFINGPDLDTHLKEKGRLALAEARPIIQDIAGALDYAHAQGLVHRDIKASNVMLEPITATAAGSRPQQTQRAVLTDFGIARIVGGGTRFTQTGGVLGTFDYIAPEQIQAIEEIDGRADVYALGVMVYLMLTGELPFKQRNPGTLLLAHMTQPPPDPRDIVPDLPREVAHALRQAMAKMPEERFATAGEFAGVLA